MIAILRQRIAAAWRTKLILGGVLACAFWVVYAHLERKTAAKPFLMPRSFVDGSLPLCPFAAWIYVSQFFTTPLLLWLAPTRRTVVALCAGVGLMASVSFLVYYSFPTQVERPEAAVGRNFAYDLVMLLDLPRNACPSLHAGFAVFLLACTSQLTRGIPCRWLWLVLCQVWTLAVLASTLLIRQHVVVDLAAGALVGFIAYGTVRGWVASDMNALDRTQQPKAPVCPGTGAEDGVP